MLGRSPMSLFGLKAFRLSAVFVPQSHVVRALPTTGILRFQSPLVADKMSHRLGSWLGRYNGISGWEPSVVTQSGGRYNLIGLARWFGVVNLCDHFGCGIQVRKVSRQIGLFRLANKVAVWHPMDTPVISDIVSTNGITEFCNFHRLPFV
jgi:hypothetical protein